MTSPARRDDRRRGRRAGPGEGQRAPGRRAAAAGRLPRAAHGLPRRLAVRHGHRAAGGGAVAASRSTGRADADVVPTDRRNLVWRAAELLAAHAGRARRRHDRRSPSRSRPPPDWPAAAPTPRPLSSPWTRCGAPGRAAGTSMRSRPSWAATCPSACSAGSRSGSGRGEQLSPVLARTPLALGARHRGGGPVHARGLRASWTGCATSARLSGRHRARVRRAGHRRAPQRARRPRWPRALANDLQAPALALRPELAARAAGGDRRRRARPPW